MKLTIITDEQGGLVGTIREAGQKAAAVKGNGDPRAHVVVDPKHRTHEVEVPDELHSITDANKFHEKLSRYVPR
jgi:hypothetical protein